MFGLIHCPGTTKDKAKVLYGLIQDGGLANEENVRVSASDKDLIPVFKKLCTLASIDIFLLA